MAREPPTSGMFSETPVISCPMPWIVRPVGMASSASRFSTCDLVVLCTSTVGDAPETVRVSSSDPTFSSVFTVIVKSDGSSMPSRLTVEKPSSEKVSGVGAGPQIDEAVGAAAVGDDRPRSSR